jgi:glycosyltransferase involved in cell wall biosynthesis
VSSNQPLVSIIIPCYNYARYLAEAIESALAQTYSPVQIIVVDDGSTDETQEVARRYPVRLLRQENQGPPATTNNGVRASSGEFIVRLDADDVLYPQFVEKTVAALERNQSAPLAHTEAEYMGTATGRVPFKPFDPEALAEGALATSTSLFRRAAWDAVGGLDPAMILCDDWDLWLTFAEHGLKGVLVPEILWAYRQHGPSMVNRSLLSMAGLRREYQLISKLHDRHPELFAPRHLIRRLRSMPNRVVHGQMSLGAATKLFAFNSVMLVRAALQLHSPRPRVFSWPALGAAPSSSPNVTVLSGNPE